MLSRHSLSPDRLPVVALAEHLATLTGRAGTFVVPTLLSLSRLTQYGPCEHYGLAAQFVFNQLLGEVGPYRDELQPYVGHEGRLRQVEGVLLAGVMGPDRDAASVILQPAAAGRLALPRYCGADKWLFHWFVSRFATALIRCHLIFSQNCDQLIAEVIDHVFLQVRSRIEWNNKIQSGVFIDFGFT